jgi:surface antigen
VSGKPIVRERSYSAGRVTRQPLVAATVAALAFALSACAGLTVPAPAEDVTAATTTAAPTGLAGLSADDLLAIGSALSEPYPRSGDLVWANADSGSQGRISAIKVVSGPAGVDCRAFATIVNAVDGLRSMRGVACRDADGRYAVEGLAPAVAGG